MFRYGLIIAALVVFVDQAAKWVILLQVMQPPRVVDVTPFFNIVLTFNRGISFGLFASGGQLGTIILTIVALAIVAFLLSWLRKTTDRLSAAGIGLVVGGALGNVTDRLVHNAVVDFLDFHLGGQHWPAFNVADASITIGAILLILHSLFSGRENADELDSGSSVKNDDD